MPDTIPAESNAASAPSLEGRIVSSESAAASEFTDMPLLCDYCGYDVRSTSAPRCPECGRSVDPDAARLTMRRLLQVELNGRSARQFALVTWALLAIAGYLLSPATSNWRSTNNMSRRAIAVVVFMSLTCFYIEISRARRAALLFGKVRGSIAPERAVSYRNRLRALAIHLGAQVACYLLAILTSL